MKEEEFVHSENVTSCAENLRPVIATSDAIWRPTFLTILGSPPAAAYSPTVASGNPKDAVGDATTISLTLLSTKSLATTITFTCLSKFQIRRRERNRSQQQ
jgi:hypothetical protein